MLPPLSGAIAGARCLDAKLFRFQRCFLGGAQYAPWIVHHKTSRANRDFAFHVMFLCHEIPQGTRFSSREDAWPSA